MPKRSDVKKVLVIGSGPIIIGQAAEFDYAGTQACRALKEEGLEVVLVNSNPATIMTDKTMADKIYIEPLNVEIVKRIIDLEKPDSVLANMGGQTGLNIGMELSEGDFLSSRGVKLLGVNPETIRKAEDRQAFKDTMLSIGEPCIPSKVVESVEDAVAFAHEIEYPVVVRPAYTLGGTGGGFVHNDEEMLEICAGGLRASMIHQVLIEKSVAGWKEIEFEVIRDGAGNAIDVCSMENVDPVGVHTGDSIVVAPSQTLTNKEYHLLRDSALRLIRALKIEGGCNVQFALDPQSFQYYVIEVNPRVSRSSALASKASGYPIARVSAKISVGMRLDEIRIANTPASFEPTLDYVVTKMPRFPFDKFANASNTLSTQMKATGEVMAVGRTLQESILKAVRSLEIGVGHIYMSKFDSFSDKGLLDYIRIGTDDRVFAIAELMSRGADLGQIWNATKIDMLFLDKISNIVRYEEEIKARPWDPGILRKAKRKGFSDKAIAWLWKCTEREVFDRRKELGIFPVYKMIDTCASEFESYIPYFYSTYEDENESIVSEHKKVIVLGSGPIRIGQGVEFDYSTVHAVQTIKRSGYDAIIINNNPETVSTDYTCSDKLYFEPLTVEDVMNIIELEKPEGVIASLGGQTAINLAQPLMDHGVKIIGTGCAAIERAEDRKVFEQVLHELDIPQPRGEAVTNLDDGVRAAGEIGYPVLVRPSFVLGGRAMEIVANEEMLRHYLRTAVEVDADKPVLVDKYIIGKEVEVDAICDGKDVFVPGIMELVERTGVHSGDSVSVYPTFSISQAVKDTILDYTKKLGLGIGIVGLYNIQFIVDRREKVYIIEVNPRSSRTVPFLSKATGWSLADIATKVILGESLRDQGITELYPAEKQRWYCKVPVFSFSKLSGLDAYLSPEMKSTGEAIGYDERLPYALYKAMQAAGMKLMDHGTVLLSVCQDDLEEALPLVRRFYYLGFNIEATTGTARFLKEHGIRTRVKKDYTEDPADITAAMRGGKVAYLINTRDPSSSTHVNAGVEMRRLAIENNVTAFTSLDTVRALLDVLEAITSRISTIDA